MTQKVKCIVVDDEPIARQYLSDYIGKMPQLELVASYGRALDAFDSIEKGEAELVFLDIQMPGLTGLEFIRSLQKKPAIILTTAYSEYALESYELDVVDYLLKPIPFERFVKAVNKAASRINSAGKPRVESDETNVINTNNQRDYIFVKSGYKSMKVNIADILYVEGMKEYVVIHTNEKKYTKLDRMKNIENQLSESGFIRIHKSFIVSINHIDSVFGNVLEVNGKQLPIGRSYKDDLTETLGMGE